MSRPVAKSFQATSESLSSDTERQSKVPTVMVMSGEASGDEHAASVVSAMRQKNPQIQFFGMGGSALRAAGVETVVDSEESASVMGLTEVLGSLGGLIKAFLKLRRAAKDRRPDIVLLVDFPDFNMLFARAVHTYCSHIVYFITPQIWAWRTKRVRTIAKYVSKVIPIFPFEEKFYRSHGVDATFVGHPYLDRPALKIDRDAFLKAHGLDPRKPVVALLPGSRTAEVTRLAVPMRDAWRRLQQSRPDVQAIVPIAATLELDWVQQEFGDSDIVCVPGNAREILLSADVAVVASGTATLEAALAEIPFVVIYKLSDFTYAVGKRLVKGVSHIAMPNLIAGEEVIPELIQENASAERIAAELERYLGDRAHYDAVRKRLGQIRSQLAGGLEREDGSSDRVADIVLGLFRDTKQEA